MNRYKKQKQSFYLMLIILLILGVGIGYALLTETLTISNSAMLAEMKWDVGFSNVEDNGSTIPVDAEISNNGKTMTVLCDFGSNTEQQTCTVKATIKNDSTFDIGLKNDPVISYDDTYIHTATFKWAEHPTYENHTVLKDNFIKKGESEEVILTIKTKNLKADMLPTQALSIPITITLNFEQWQGGELPETEDLAVLKTHAQLEGTAFLTEPYYSEIDSCSWIRNITFEDSINIPDDAIESWDIGVSENENVIAYVVTNEEDSTYYDLYIQSKTQLYANEDMSYWFSGLNSIELINGLDLLNTSMTVNMAFMFYQAGYDNTNFTLNVSNFDTSEVTNMCCMFNNVGYYNTTFTLDVSNFDTSSVTNMYGLFNNVGYYNTVFSLDVSNFDTSQVTNMGGMFNRVGYYSTIFSLDVSNFYTSNVTDMAFMFYQTGYSSPNFTLDVSDFDTSKVTNMAFMFYQVGYNSTKLNTSITIRNPNISSYSSYGSMFSDVATKGDSKITVNYVGKTSELVDKMIATKSSNSNVVKGALVS